MNKYILFLVCGLSATISYSTNLDKAREDHKRNRQAWKNQNREREEWNREKKKLQKLEKTNNEMVPAGLQGQKSACVIL